MPVLLALDASTSACSVALYKDGETISEYIEAPREHTRLLLPMIERSFSGTKVTAKDLSAVAFSVGPGSFTGLRIGFGIVQGLSYALDIPVIPVSTLAVLAMGARRQYRLNSGESVLPALDARMGEVNWACYRVDEYGVSVCHDDQLSSPEEVKFDKPVDWAVGSGWIYKESIPVQPLNIDENLNPDARDIIDLAVHLFERGCAKPVREVELAYLRNEIAWQKRQRLRST